jgi:DNA-directed RNA polymerase specialized sigma24 family protein
MRILIEHAHGGGFDLAPAKIFEEGIDVQRALDALREEDRSLLVAVYGEGRAMREACGEDLRARDLRKRLDRLEASRKFVMERMEAA